MFVRRHISRARRVAATLSAAVLLALVVTSTVGAAGGGATIVRGIQHEYGSCGNSDGYLMTGALDGCWWVDTFELQPHPAQAGMLARGTEHFTGCLGSVCGTFTTTYTYTARFDGATELHGRCHHPVTGGTGGFAGARGELNFTDVVDQEPFFYPYWGNIQLGRGSTTVASTTVALAARTAPGRAPAVAAPC